MTKEMTSIDVWKLFKKYAVSLVIFTLIGGVLGFVTARFWVDNEYQSETQLVVIQSDDKKNEDSDYVTLQTNVSLGNTYRDIITSDGVLAQANKALGKGYHISTIKEAISTEQTEDSQIIKVTSTMTSPEEAQKLLQHVIESLRNTLNEIYGEGERFYVLTEPTYSAISVSPKISLYVVVGALLGFLVGAIIASIRQLEQD